MTTPALAELIAILESQIGIREEGEDRGPDIVKFQHATCETPGKWPWCAAFVCWVLREWLKNPVVRSTFGLGSDAEVEAWRFRDVAAFDCEVWAAGAGLRVLPPGSLAQAGDIAVFAFSHIGFVVQDPPDAQAELHTIEGNTPVARRWFRQVDGVDRKRRAPGLIRCFVRLEKI